ncbi:MAG: UvrB/UvrC motif-containing protein [Clostridia bacterium]|nr:UvrB/UvrC motif-containing protein [Clostridia bacterium]
MLCQKCGKNPATTHIHSVIGGIVKDVDLCQSCAAEQGYHSNSVGSLASMLSSVFGDVSVPVSANVLRCDCCGTSFREISSTGKAGCPNCYVKFKKEFLPYLKRVHGGVHHIGKKPARDQLVVSVNDKLTEMRKKLSELVKNENYEEAAVVRDEIRRIEGEQKHD